MYSQNREEEVILKYFESPAGNIKAGNLLSVGENDGVTLSNARALILAGWSAVLVEPDPLAFERLQHLYREKENIECWRTAIGTVDGKETFYSSGVHLNRGDTGLLSSLKESELARFPGTEYTKTEVNVYTLKTLLSKSKYKQLDFVSLDAEGMDLDILKQMDFTEMQTKLVCVEWNSKDRHLYDQVMYKFRFGLIYVSAENLIYAR